MDVLLTKTKKARVSDIVKGGRAGDESFARPQAPVRGCTIYLVGTLTDSESIKLQYPDGDGWKDYKETLSNSSPVQYMYGSAWFRVSKLATASAAGVEITFA